LPKSDVVRRQILDTLTGAGGRIEAASVRRLASLIAVPKSTVHGALGTLLASGAIVRAGKALTLAG
jgi:DNA-binding IclR family transcriptional regulator